MNETVELSILCDAHGFCDQPFDITIRSECGGAPVFGSTRSGIPARFSLCAGHYTIRVSGPGDLNPGAYTKWLKLAPKKRYQLVFLFSKQVFHFVVPVRFTLTDVNYPEITNIHGGITVWQQQSI